MEENRIKFIYHNKVSYYIYYYIISILSIALLVISINSLFISYGYSGLVFFSPFLLILVASFISFFIKGYRIKNSYIILYNDKIIYKSFKEEKTILAKNISSIYYDVVTVKFKYTYSYLKIFGITDGINHIRFAQKMYIGEYNNSNFYQAYSKLDGLYLWGPVLSDKKYEELKGKIKDITQNKFEIIRVNINDIIKEN